MGRRRSMLGILLSEMERSARRAESARLRAAQRAEGVRVRALERELIREERASERERVRRERALALVQAESERQAVSNSRKAAKEAQLRAWQLEVDTHRQRDEELLSIGNEAPEVEDRDRLYAELLKPSAYEPPSFTPPELTPEAIKPLHEKHSATLRTLVERFQPAPSNLDFVQLCVGVSIAVGGGLAMLPKAPSAVGFAAVGLVGTWACLEAVRTHRRAAQLDAYAEDMKKEAERSLAREVEALRLQQATEASRSFEERVEQERANHEAEQARRQDHLRALQSGNAEAMGVELGSMFPLDGLDAFDVRSTVESPSKVRLEVTAPLGDVMQRKSSSILASGKASYRKKTQKQFREECERVLSGLAFRVASEAMLLLPSVTEVEVSCTNRQASRAANAAMPLLTVQFDYAKLAPLTMADLNPHPALEHFPHEDRIAASAIALWREAE